MIGKTKDKYKNYFLYFMMYSVFGWIYEVFLEVFVYGWGFSNRGILYGPYCPIYGVGALMLIFTVNRLIDGKDLRYRLKMLIPVFLLSALIATAIELAATYLCEYFMGYWPWQTYADYKINFQARIALSPSVRFGIGGVVILYIIQPIFEKAVKGMGQETRESVFSAVLLVLLLDIALFLIKNLNYLN